MAAKKYGGKNQRVHLGACTDTDFSLIYRCN